MQVLILKVFQLQDFLDGCIVIFIIGMGTIPSLFSMCISDVKRGIICGDKYFEMVYDLPSDLFDILLMEFPPLVLQNLHARLLSQIQFDNFDLAWKELCGLRWPNNMVKNQIPNSLIRKSVTNNELINTWHEKYWEKHIQNCMDEATESALLPSFSGCISDNRISDSILSAIGFESHMINSNCDWSKLSHHCQQLGHYVRCLRLQNVLFCSEICDLLQTCKLQSLILCKLKSKEHVDELCKLLVQNRGTLTMLEFIDCRISSIFAEQISFALHLNSKGITKISHIIFKSSHFLESSSVSLPSGIQSLFSSSFLSSLTLCEVKLSRAVGKMVFNTLLSSSSNIRYLDISENNISGLVSDINSALSNCFHSSVKSLSLGSLIMLNLRGNNFRVFDVKNLESVLSHMPMLETLDLSDNPIEDQGIKKLFPYFITKASQPSSCFSNLRVEGCGFSPTSTTPLLEILSSFVKPLYSLSVANNNLGSQLAFPLAKLLDNSIKVLSIKDTSFSSSGFLKLRDALPLELKLLSIDMSNNRGGIEAARFLSALFLRAPGLVEVDGSYNLMPADSIDILFSGFKTNGVEYVDLRGNLCYEMPAHADILDKFRQDGRPLLLLPSFPTSCTTYDDDP